ncbi:MAG: hypothetical protein KA116_08915 [Proteobacteria bacterium]|nr:hypothetical protein [Pseudomonadota bacterium]
MKTTLLRAILLGFVAHSTLGFSSEVSDKMDIKVPSVKKTRQKKKRKKQKISKVDEQKSRAPASEPVVETYVFDEFTSFENLLEKRQVLERNPASFQVKARVISVRRDVGLTNKEDDKSRHDIVLNAGVNSGITKGMSLTVKRHIPILDPYRENKQRELEVELARLEVVHVQDDIAVARVSKLMPIDEGLSIGMRSVLIGDYVGTGN